MRLDTALLLLGVIVIVSSIKSLQARALDGEKSNTSVRGSLRSDGAGSTGEEDRTLFGHIAKLAEGCSGNSAVAVKAMVSSLPKSAGYETAAARFSTSDYHGVSEEAAMNLLHSDLDSLLNSWWATRHQIPHFQTSPQYKEMSALVRHVSNLPSVKRTMSLEEVLGRMFTFDDLLKIRYRPLTESEEAEWSRRQAMWLREKKTERRQLAKTRKLKKTLTQLGRRFKD